MTMMRSLAPLVAALLALAPMGRADAAELPVDLELVLAVDVSRSMDNVEQELQREGYRSALRHREVIDAIRSGPHGRIALTYVEWAGPQDQAVIVPWMLVEDGESADVFAGAILTAASFGRMGTSISSGLAFASGLFEGNGFAGERRVIDISGDGPNNLGPPVELARDTVLARGITINGLPIVLRPGGGMSRFDIRDLDAYYRDCVVGGPGAFTIPVTTTEAFEATIRRKLILEIAAAPPLLIPIAADAPSVRANCMIGETMRQQWFR